MTHHFEIESRAAAPGSGWRLRILQQEPGGKDVEMSGGIESDLKGPLFRAANRKTKILTARPLSRTSDISDKMSDI